MFERIAEIVTRGRWNFTSHGSSVLNSAVSRVKGERDGDYCRNYDQVNVTCYRRNHGGSMQNMGDIIKPS